MLDIQELLTVYVMHVDQMNSSIVFNVFIASQFFE